MKTIKLGTSNLDVPVFATGCLRMARKTPQEVNRLVHFSMENGVNFFDHADIYGSEVGEIGTCESVFGEALAQEPGLRGKLIIQTKCGITLSPDFPPDRQRLGFDFSRDNILKSVDNSLRRLKTDYIDVLLLHIPDALVEPEEVAEAFDRLEQSGKVRHFGVSNHTPMQIELLKKCVKQPLVANQLQLSLMFSGIISHGMYVNLEDPRSIDHDGSVLDYCRLKDITIQCWSPLRYDEFGPSFINNWCLPEVNAKLKEMAKKYNTKTSTIAIAWLLRHPAHFQVVTGSMSEEHLKEYFDASEITLDRADWYELWLAAGNRVR